MWPNPSRNDGKPRQTTPNQILKKMKTSKSTHEPTSNSFIFNGNISSPKIINGYQDFSSKPVKIKPMQTIAKRKKPITSNPIINRTVNVTKPSEMCMPIIVSAVSLNTDANKPSSTISQKINKGNAINVNNILKNLPDIVKKPLNNKPIETINLDVDDDIISLDEEDSSPIDSVSANGNSDMCLSNNPQNSHYKPEKENCIPVKDKNSVLELNMNVNKSIDKNEKDVLVKNNMNFSNPSLESTKNIIHTIVIDDIYLSETEQSPEPINSNEESSNSGISNETNKEKDNDVIFIENNENEDKSSSPTPSKPSPVNTKTNVIKKSSSLESDKKNVDSKIDLNSEIKNEPNTPSQDETYQIFLNLCIELDDSDDMKKIVEKKLKNYYKSVDPQFTNSDKFRSLIEEKIIAMKKSPEFKFVHIKEIADELKSRRSKAKSNLEKSESSTTIGDDIKSDDLVNNETEEKIKKLERKLNFYKRVISRLDEQEVDFEDENDSPYVLVDKYKSKFMAAYKKLCLIKKEEGIEASNAKKTVSKLSLGEGRIPHLNKAVMTLASSSPNWFPDFHEILKCVHHCVLQSNLNMTTREIRDEARLVFTDIGKALQKKRQSREYQNLCNLLIENDEDPAVKDPELAATLEKNSKNFKNREMEIINKFATADSVFKSMDDSDKQACTPTTSLNQEKPESSDATTELTKKRVQFITIDKENKMNYTNLSQDEDSDIEIVFENINNNVIAAADTNQTFATHSARVTKSDNKYLLTDIQIISEESD